MHALVTGGAGFIGSHLVERLLDDRHMVTVIDNFSSGRRENLEHVRVNPDLHIHQSDVSRYETICPLFAGVDWVFHLAALADIVPSIQQPLRYHSANVDGTIAALEAARAAGTKRFIYAASSSCYGVPRLFPTPETATIDPLYPYALTKYLAEQYVLHWHFVYGLPTITLRLFNVYGPRARAAGSYGAVLGVFLAQKLAGKPFTVVGDGSQTRDFTFVGDVIDAFMMAAASPVAGETFNVGSGGTYSINDLVGLLGGEVVHIPKRPGEPDCTFADISKITRELGWVPKISLDEGIRRVIRDLDGWRDAPVWDECSIAAATKDWFTFLGRRSKRAIV